MSENTKLERQIELEQEAVGLGVRRYRAELTPWNDPNRVVKAKDQSETPPGQLLMREFMVPMIDMLAEWKAKSAAGKANRGAYAARYLEKFDNETLAFITAKRVINSIDKGDSPQKVALGIAKWLENELDFRQFQATAPGLYKVIMDRLKKTTHSGHKAKVLSAACNKVGVARENWGKKEQLAVGVKLIEMLIASTGMFSYERVVKVRNGRPNVSTSLQPTEYLTGWLERQHARCELLSPMYLPMVVKPQPWSNPLNGGYITPGMGRLKFVKTQNSNYIEELRNKDLSATYAAVNVLQETPWRVNRRLFQTMRTLWEEGATLAGLPAREDTPLPAKPHNIDTDAEALSKWKQQAAPIHERNALERSKRFTMSQKLWIAEKFYDDAEIFFPHTLDWRGRAYPVPGLVHPQADDTGKALLEFAEGKELGPDGGYWLAVHIANLFGVDKVSLDERVQWVQDRSFELRMYAVSPGDHRGWTEADKPWQALAACMEWDGFCQNPEGFVSHLPVALDGSCNGLQNFSALLLDAVGGKAVNLVPGDKPEDIYTEVAELVSRKVAKAATEGEAIAALWVDKVTRKVVKRPCMTLAYGATRSGMRNQIREELVKADQKGEPIIAKDRITDASAYLGDLVYASIGEVVVAARAAMDWLRDVAKLAAKDGLPLSWTTPIGLPVMQMYQSMESKRIEIYQEGQRYRFRLSNGTGKLDKKKQAQGIAPNFIHSCDASHMMATILKCKEHGINSLAMIHDSYGTHAANAGMLSLLLRECFVEMYSKPVLENFRNEVAKQLPEEMVAELPPVPPMGSLELEAVLESDYFFA